MDEKIVRQLMLVKYYLSMAASQYQIDQEPSKFAAINLLHEALEATLITCADHLNANVSDRTTIDLYLTRINEKLADKSLPLRTRVLEFNRARISAKHALILPDSKPLTTFFEVIPEFVKEACRTVFGVELDKISLVDLITNEEVRGYVAEAIKCSEAGEYFNGLAGIRKALYVLFEKRFDISVFANTADNEKIGMLDPRIMCEAPHYAKSNRYVRDNVRDPHNYIVLDHAKLDAEALKLGIDTHTFWNVWRLTPSVWRRPTGEWVIKHDINIMQSPNMAGDLRYVIEVMIAISLQIQARRSQERYKHSAYFKSIRVKSEAPLYSKASESSVVNDTIPVGVDRINVIDAVQGLDSAEWWWTASYMKKGGPFLGGYLRNSDTIGELLEGIYPFADD